MLIIPGYFNTDKSGRFILQSGKFCFGHPPTIQIPDNSKFKIFDYDIKNVLYTDISITVEHISSDIFLQVIINDKTIHLIGQPANLICEEGAIAFIF